MALHTLKKKVFVKCKRVGAFDRICYPNCETSSLLCQLAGCEFFTDYQMKIIELIGFKIVCEIE